MKLHVDKEADALYLRLDDSAIVESEEVSPGVVLDYNASSTLKPERDMATGSIKPEWEKRGLNYDTEYISSRD